MNLYDMTFVSLKHCCVCANVSLVSRPRINSVNNDVHFIMKKYILKPTVEAYTQISF